MLYTDHLMLLKFSEGMIFCIMILGIGFMFYSIKVGLASLFEIN